MPLMRIAEPLVRHLSERTGTSAHLVVPSYGSVVCVVHSGASDLMNEAVQLHEAMPAHATAGGKLLLAFRPNWLRSFMDHEDGPIPLSAWTRRTITDPARLLAELDSVQRAGHAFERGEFRHDVDAVAVPIRQGDEVVAALCASGVKLDTKARTESALAELESTAFALRRKLDET
jgi:DNA-binding IclR family transcriptional regulator